MKSPVQAGLLLALLTAAAGAAEPRAETARNQEALYVNVCDDAGETLAGLTKLARSGDWTQAVEQAQNLIGAGPGKLFEIEPGLYVSFAERVRREICAWPEPGIRAYRARYDAAAEKLCRKALDARSARDLSEVASLYLASSAAPRALAALADIHIQRGELRNRVRLGRDSSFRARRSRDSKFILAGPPRDQ